MTLRKATFAPRDVVVRTGEAVTWMHKDGRLPHSVVADDGSFNSHPACGGSGGACMTRGDRYTHTFTEPGTFSYYCRPHGAPGGQGMAGTVRVGP